MEQLQFTLIATHEQLIMLRTLCEYSENDTGTIQEQITVQLAATNWDEAQRHVHDASGIEKPEDWKWKRVNGIFYPACLIVK